MTGYGYPPLLILLTMVSVIFAVPKAAAGERIALPEASIPRHNFLVWWDLEAATPQRIEAMIEAVRGHVQHDAGNAEEASHQEVEAFLKGYRSFWEAATAAGVRRFVFVQHAVVRVGRGSPAEPMYVFVQHQPQAGPDQIREGLIEAVERANLPQRQADIVAWQLLPTRRCYFWKEQVQPNALCLRRYIADDMTIAVQLRHRPQHFIECWHEKPADGTPCS